MLVSYTIPTYIQIQVGLYDRGWVNDTIRWWRGEGRRLLKSAPCGVAPGGGKVLGSEVPTFGQSWSIGGREKRRAPFPSCLYIISHKELRTGSGSGSSLSHSHFRAGLPLRYKEA